MITLFSMPLTPWLQVALGLLLVSNFILLSSERQVTGIRMLVLQGCILGIIPLLLETSFSWELTALACIFLSIKAVVLPLMLQRAHQKLPPSPPLPSYLNDAACVGAGLAGFAFALWLASLLPEPANALFLPFFPPAFATILAGLLVIVTRRKALTQVMGYLVMENGIYLLGVPMARHDALWIELSILLDIFVGIFIMILTIHHLHSAFSTTDVEKITSLKEQI